MSVVDRRHGKGRQRQYRDMPRRIRYLSDLMDDGRFNSFTLRKYAPRVLVTMRKCIRFECAFDLNVEEENWRAIATAITCELCRRFSRPVRPERTLMVSRFVGRALDKVRIEAALRADDALKELPDSIREEFAPPMVAWYYPITLGQRFFNFKHFITESSRAQLVAMATGRCDCASRGSLCDPDHGHVATCDLSVVSCLELRELLAKGTSHRMESAEWGSETADLYETSPYKDDPRLAALHAGLTKWVEGQEECDNFEGYVSTVMSDIKCRLDRFGPYVPPSDGEFTTGMRRALRDMQQSYVFGYVDKFSSKFMFTCKKFYAMTMLREFRPSWVDGDGGGEEETKEEEVEQESKEEEEDDESGTYEEVEESTEEILRHHADFCEREGIDMNAFSKKPRQGQGRGAEEEEEDVPKGELAYPMASGNLHKSPLAFRFIACSSGYSLRALSVWLGKAFKALMPTLNGMWCAKFLEGGVGTDASWILNHSARVPELIERLNNSIPRTARSGVKICTYDFKKMYTNINLSSLKQRMKDLLAALFAHARSVDATHRVLRVGTANNRFSWLSQEGEGTGQGVDFTAAKLSRWLWFLLDNIYLQFTSDCILRQRIGIPMGTNCAVFVANMFCFWFEFLFAKRLVDRGKTDLLRKLTFCRRFVDDLLICNVPEFSDYLYVSQRDNDGILGIYPPYLVLSEEQRGLSEVSFLDVHIMFDRHWYTKVYDKREHPPLNRIDQTKYPHPSSFLSDRSKYGVIISQMHRFGRICQRRVDFEERVRMFLAEFVGRGYPYDRVLVTVTRFLRVNRFGFAVPRKVKLFARSLMPER